MAEFENEKLDKEELEQVAGGSCYDLADDSRFLNTLNGSTDRWGATNFWLDGSGGKKFKAIEAAWAKLGVGLICPDDPTGTRTKIQYVLLDSAKEITQEQARQHAMEVTGHHMSYSDWHW